MKKLVSLFLIISILSGVLSPAAAQNFKTNRNNSSLENIRDFAAQFVQYAKQDAIRSSSPPRNETPALEAEAAFLMKECKRSLSENDTDTFYKCTMELNSRLLSYLDHPEWNTKLLGAAILLNQIKEGTISLEDADKAFKVFEKLLKDTESCNGVVCQYISIAATALGYSGYYYKQMKEFVVSPKNEMSLIPEEEQEKRERIGLLKNAAQRGFGKPEANALVAPGLITGMAVLGSLDDVYETAEHLINRSNWGRRAYGGKRAAEQIAAMDTLFELGPQAIPVLKKYAFEVHSDTSHLHANINLAYADLNEEDRNKVKRNIELYYCHYAFNLNSGEDMVLRQKMAYAYHGAGVGVVYQSASAANSCVVLYPTKPDPRLVSEEWTHTVMSEAVFFAAMSGIGTAINAAVKAGVKALRGAAANYKANKHNISLSRFFFKGKPRSSGTAKRPAGFKKSSGKGSPQVEDRISRLIEEKNYDELKKVISPDKAEMLSFYNESYKPTITISMKNLFIDGIDEKYMLKEYLPKDVLLKRLNLFNKKNIERIIEGKSIRFLIIGSNVSFPERHLLGSSMGHVTIPIGNRAVGVDLEKMKEIVQAIQKIPYQGKRPLVFSYLAHGGCNRAGTHLSDVGGHKGGKKITDLVKNIFEAKGDETSAIILFESCFGGAAMDDFLKIPLTERQGIELITISPKNGITRAELSEGKSYRKEPFDFVSDMISDGYISVKYTKGGKRYSLLEMAVNASQKAGRYQGIDLKRINGELRALNKLFEISVNDKKKIKKAVRNLPKNPKGIVIKGTGNKPVLNKGNLKTIKSYDYVLLNIPEYLRNFVKDQLPIDALP